MVLAYVTKEATRHRRAAESPETEGCAQGPVSRERQTVLWIQVCLHVSLMLIIYKAIGTPQNHLGQWGRISPDLLLLDFVFSLHLTFFLLAHSVPENSEHWPCDIPFRFTHDFVLCFSYQCGAPHQVRWHVVLQVLQLFSHQHQSSQLCSAARQVLYKWQSKDLGSLPAPQNSGLKICRDDGKCLQ